MTALRATWVYSTQIPSLIQILHVNLEESKEVRFDEARSWSKALNEYRCVQLHLSVHILSSCLPPLRLRATPATSRSVPWHPFTETLLFSADEE